MNYKLRHATFNAIACLCRYQAPSEAYNRIACDWDIDSHRYTIAGIHIHNHLFTAPDAVALMNGGKVDFPTCPTCAVFVDIALDYGNEVEYQARLRKEQVVDKEIK